MTRKVLLIEDNAQNRYLATFLLEGKRWHVVGVEDGVRGIEMARGTSFDLVLLDIQLPKMDGYAVARALRQIDAMRNTPIIAVTSHAMMGDRERCLEAGCDGYIEKPIDPETFVSTIDAFVADYSAQGGST